MHLMAIAETTQLPHHHHGCQSLAHAIRLVAKNRGANLGADALVAAMGWPWLVCAAPSDDNLANWPLYARDAFLIEACKLLGLTIRPVHPPQAARGLWQVAEFRQHFDLSYRPIIEHALENDQSVLAWRGWSGETAPTWGIINGTCETGVRLQGTPCLSDATDADTTPTPLDQPPVQVYIVESVENKTPSPTALAAHLEQTARRAISGELDEAFAVITGPAAIDLWIEALAANRIDTDACAGMLHSFLRSQQSLARILGGDVSSNLLQRNADAIATMLDEYSETNPLPTLREIRNLLVELYDALTEPQP